MSKLSPRLFYRCAPLGPLALTLIVFGCNTDSIDSTVTGTVPFDYRERHPIRMAEGERSVQLLIGSGRGDLTADQRAHVTSMASSWRREGTGILFIEVPSGTTNERAAKYAAREVRSLLQASGVPSRAITTRSYRAEHSGGFGPVRIAYARIVAEAGPCGQWPEDLGPAMKPSLAPVPPDIDNRPYWNFGCASQHNLAAVVANPEDLIQPRPETPPLASRRQTVIEKYRKGEDPSGQYKTEEVKASNVQ